MNKQKLKYINKMIKAYGISGGDPILKELFSDTPIKINKEEDKCWNIIRNKEFKT